jgi:putative glutamine amidotransferase
MHPKVNSVDTDRDRVELFVLQEVIQRQTPFLGICRGFQVINVGLGGTLYEDILDQHPGGMDHSHQPGAPRDHLTHAVAVEPESKLGQILGQKSVPVNSLHHQGVRRLAPTLRPTATSPDGLIEAYELPGYPFGLAVQWHPECLPDHPAMQRLFQAFVQAAGNRKG